MTELDRRTFLGSTLLVGTAVASLDAAETPSDVNLIGRTPHTKFAVNVEMWWTKLPFLERLKMAAKLGFPAVEFWPWKGRDIDAIAGLCQELNIAIAQFTAWGFTPGLNDPQNHSEFVAAVTAGCEVAKRLDCKLMTVVGGNDQPGISQVQMHDNIIQGLKLAAPIAEENDVTLILEPMNIRVDHKGHCLYGSAPSIRICQAVGSAHVKINWDLYHLQITEGDLCGHLKEGFDTNTIGYLQLADHPGRNEPGTGEVHYNRVLQTAHALGYRGYVGLECRPRGDERAAAIAVSKADIW